MKIVVIGLGYVGFPLAVVLSRKNEVYCMDIAEEKKMCVRERRTPFSESKLEEFLREESLSLSVAESGKDCFPEADYIIIALPTDYDEKTKLFNTESVEEVMEGIFSEKPDACVVLKSTVPLGYTKKLQRKYSRGCILFSPEFLREGNALYDTLYPSRIIVGCDVNDAVSLGKAECFMALIKTCTEKKEVFSMVIDTTEAEAVKLFSNTYLAMRVAFFNELDTYAETKNLNTKNIITGICSDPRIGNYYNNPSFGYGGYCLPKDAKELLANYRDIPEDLIRAVIESNRTRKKYTAERIIDLAKSLHKEEPVIGIYRLTMKTSSDNFRNSAVLDVMEELKGQNFKIIVYEPGIKFSHSLPMYDVCGDLKAFKAESDLIVANRYSEEIADVMEKVYTRDVFGRD